MGYLRGKLGGWEVMKTARKNSLLNHSPRVHEESKTAQVKDDEWEGRGSSGNSKQQPQAFPLVGKEVVAMNLARGWVVGMKVLVMKIDWCTSN